MKSLNPIRLFATPWTVAHQAPLSIGFSRQEFWSGLPFPPPEDLPNPGIKPKSPALRANALTSEPSSQPRALHTWHMRNSTQETLLSRFFTGSVTPVTKPFFPLY